MPYALRKNHPCPNCKNRGQLSYMWANGQANGQDMLRCDVCGFVAMDGQMIGGDEPGQPPALRSAAEIRERIGDLRRKLGMWESGTFPPVAPEAEDVKRELLDSIAKAKMGPNFAKAAENHVRELRAEIRALKWVLGEDETP